MLNVTQTLLDKDDFGDAVSIEKDTDPEVWRKQYEVCLQYKHSHWILSAGSLHGIYVPNLPCWCLM